MNPNQPASPPAPPAQPEHRSLGRLVFEGPGGSRDVVSEVWSDKPLDLEQIMNAITQRVGAELPTPADRPAQVSPTDRR